MTEQEYEAMLKECRQISRGFGIPLEDPPKVQSITLYDRLPEKPSVLRMNSGSQSYTFRKSGKIAGEQVTTTVGCVKDGVVVHEYPEGESPCDVCGKP